MLQRSVFCRGESATEVSVLQLLHAVYKSGS